MVRLDWTKPKEQSNKINLSNNVCYDDILMDEMKSIKVDLHNYPDEYFSYKALSDFYNQPMQNITLGYGLSELINRILNIFQDKTFSIISPTWLVVESMCNALHIRHVTKYDIKSQVVYIANPNGRTGELISNEEIYDMCTKHEYVIVDEAYHDFSNSKSSLYDRPDNLIVLKTLSKSLALPGSRCAYSFASAEITLKLQEIRPAYSTINIPLDIVLPLINNHVERMLETRDYLEKNYDCIPSKGNFVLFKSEPSFINQFETKKFGDVTRMSLINKELLND